MSHKLKITTIIIINIEGQHLICQCYEYLLIKREEKNMHKEVLDILEQPGSKKPLYYVKEGSQEFLRSDDGCQYIIDNHIIRFLLKDELTGNNKNYQKMYDRLAPLYDIITRIYASIRNGNEKNRVMQYLSELKINENDNVIEISIGTGRNIKYLNPYARYYGVDISLGMLKRCLHNMNKLNRNITLIQAEAECLPIRDETFDVVYSAGGFNFFNDKEKAIHEMLRIAKSGTKLLISDETEKVRKTYDKTPIAAKFYKQDYIKNPTEFVPKYCNEIQYKEICNGELYVLTFYKP